MAEGRLQAKPAKNLSKGEVISPYPSPHSINATVPDNDEEEWEDYDGNEIDDADAAMDISDEDKDNLDVPHAAESFQGMFSLAEMKQCDIS